MKVHAIANTDKAYQCVFCSSDNVSVVRESEDPRLKCNVCNGTFDASQSAALTEAIPESSTEELAKAEEPEQYEYKAHLAPAQAVHQQASTAPPVPKAPKFVFISKNGKTTEFATRKDLKKVALKWENRGPYNLYELVPKKSTVKLDIT